MRICFFTHYSELYGANRSLIDMIDLLVEDKLIQAENILVVLPRSGDILNELEKRRLKTLLHPFETDTYNPKYIKALLARPRRIRARLTEKIELTERIRSFSPDIIHSNSSVSLAGYHTAKTLDIPHIYHVREDIQNHYRRRHDDNRAFESALKGSSTVIATSEFIRDKIAEKGVKNIVTLYNIIPQKNVKPKDTSNEIRFGVVGFIHKSKNQEFIAKAMIPFLKKYHHASLSFYGTGDEKIINRIKSLSQRHPSVNQRIIIRGFISDPDKIFSEIDVLINLSEFEAFGRVNLEANAYSTPVIGLRSGATPELIINGKTGILIEKDVTSLRAASEQLLNLDILNNMRQEAASFFRQFNNRSKFSQTLWKTYNEALNQ